MADTTPTDFSAQLDKLWNFDKPADSEARFRTELARYPADSREALEVTTQIARAQGLRRLFAEADATLDTVAPKLDTVPPRVRVRYLLERGRTRNSSDDKARATPLFKEAAALVTDTERDNEPDGYVYEELAEIALARGNGAGAAPWAAKAHALLKDDGYLKANESARLQRLAQIARGNAK